MFNFTGEEPTHCLKSRVWMRSNAHGIHLIGGAVMIYEAPGADSSNVSMGESSPDIDAGACCELYDPRVKG